MLARLQAGQKNWVVGALGSALTISWACSYYLPAVLAAPMAASFGQSPVWVFAAFSLALVVSAMVGPWAGARIDGLGGRGVLMLSNLIFAAGLCLLALSPHVAVLYLGWAVMGLGMGIGLYEAGFASLAGIYGAKARGPITGITLIAGFASTIGWPLSGLMLAEWGWRGACFGWAILQIGVALPLNACLPKPAAAQPAAHTQDPPPSASPSLPPPSQAQAGAAPPGNGAMALLAFVFAVTWFNATAMAAHLPAVLQAGGASLGVAIAAGALIGPAQVAARLLEFGVLHRFHPLVSARLAAATHPAAALLLALFGGPAAYGFALLHGAGNGVLTIAKGTLPLALFGAGGYGQRLGWLNAPARVVQAAAPLIFGSALAAWGLGALWVTGGLGVASFVALMALQTGRRS